MSDTLKIYFRQGRSVYEPAYRENSARASVFFGRIKDFQKSSSLFSILDVTYRAGASPEGSVKGNMALSSRRCSTITDMLHGHLDFPESVVGIEDVSEDWDGLTEMVLRSQMPYRDEVLEILWGGGRIPEGRTLLVPTLAEGRLISGCLKVLSHGSLGCGYL